MKNIYKKLIVFEELITKIFLCVIILLVFIAALMRSIKLPLNWAVDIAQLLFAWTIFIGADIAMRRKKLMGVDIITEKLSKKLHKAIKLLFSLIIIIFLSLLLFYGIQLSIENYARTFQSLQISYSWATLSAPIGALLMIITTLLQIKNIIIN
ncbi:TRAP transporter small permease [Halanaerobium sp.]|jgi:TRAP-type C4-dicarboxylate transport system permease small subunit|uniref:TRAP transporter small permease n=1 Tax=Halanaerobium sp. TaxID=1895664 RepID=UPI000DE64D35|nr:TRAP transporter small permease subunit [Halanaerobium sp.]PUU89311.1 MAG: tripartite ATP-independent periplasmic transporter DctQ component [Halanaerobium sp.]